MPECTVCGAYTKFEKGLCIEHYKQKMNGVASKDIEVPEKKIAKEESHGLTDKQYSDRYNMIKGRIAETLIQELFLSLGYNVFPYGMERTIPGIMELLKGVRSDVSAQIRRMPDFVVQNRTTKDVHFVEVKFRASEEFRFSDLPKGYPYTNAFIVVVSKKHIKCLSVAELEAGEEITSASRNYLGNRSEFALDKKVIVDFCAFAVQFFASV